MFVGTAADNMADKVRKGRQQKGTGVPSSKLTPEHIFAIRSDGRSQHAIARDYGVSQAAVSLIKRGARWGHLCA
jgi:hypothetical protein